jgi:hypothetical protein
MSPADSNGFINSNGITSFKRAPPRSNHYSNHYTAISLLIRLAADK